MLHFSRILFTCILHANDGDVVLAMVVVAFFSFMLDFLTDGHKLSWKEKISICTFYAYRGARNFVGSEELLTSCENKWLIFEPSPFIF